MQTTIKVTTTGSAGSATGAATSTGGPRGWLHAIRVNWHASAPGTSVITVTEASGLQRTLYTKATASTDITLYPVVQHADNAGTAVAAQYTPYYLDGSLITVAVSVSDALTDAVVVTLLLNDKYMGAA